MPLPEGEEKGQNWWDLFDVQLSDMMEVCAEILKLYTFPKSFYTPLTVGRRPPAAGPVAKDIVDRIPPSPARADPFDTPPNSVISGSAPGRRPPTPSQLGAPNLQSGVASTLTPEAPLKQQAPENKNQPGCNEVTPAASPQSPRLSK